MRRREWSHTRANRIPVQPVGKTWWGSANQNMPWEAVINQTSWTLYYQGVKHHIHIQYKGPLSEIGFSEVRFNPLKISDLEILTPQFKWKAAWIGLMLRCSGTQWTKETCHGQTATPDAASASQSFCIYPFFFFLCVRKHTWKENFSADGVSSCPTSITVLL